jgi:serine/threonine-protein kinase
MTQDPRWRRVQELVESAEARPAEQRRAWLETEEPDAGIRGEALDMLAALEEEEAARRTIPAYRPETHPAAVGPYQIVERLGAGGRGVVYRAVRPVAGGTQEVAVKVLLEHLAGPEDLVRFQREQRILAGLNHPAIARFLDAGVDAQGRPYLALEWVDGVTIDRYCETQPISRRIALMIEALDALHAAHQSLVVHLDLKPSNILVDNAGRVRLIDFGTAKLLAAETGATRTRQLTPLYASPEQLRGEPASTASDIYSAALTLYHLVTGSAEALAGSSLAALAQRAAGVSLDVRIPGHGDLEAVLGKALRFAPAGRYRSAAEFADDLRAVLAGRPVSARPPSLLYRLRCFAGRHRYAVLAGAAAGVLCVGLAAYAAVQQQSRLREARRSQAVADFLRGMIDTSATAASGRPGMTVLEMIERAHRRIEEGAPLPPDVGALLESDFAYFASESGRDDLAASFARSALGRADRSGDPLARLSARRALASASLRLGRCPEAVTLYGEADSLLRQERSRMAPLAVSAYLAARSAVKSRCESDPAGAIAMLEEAIAESRRIQSAGLALPAAVYRASLYNAYARELIRQRRFAPARRAIQDGLQLASSHADGRYFQVALLRMLGQLEAADGQPAASLAAFERAIQSAPGAATFFERTRLELMAAARQAELGDRPSAVARARAALEQADRRAAEIGPARWMLRADAAEVMARAGECAESARLYREADAITGGSMPPDWRGNRLAFAAECAAGPAEAARLAREALTVYGAQLHPDSARHRRLTELAGGR